MVLVVFVFVVAKAKSIWQYGKRANIFNKNQTRNRISSVKVNDGSDGQTKKRKMTKGLCPFVIFLFIFLSEQGKLVNFRGRM